MSRHRLIVGFGAAALLGSLATNPSVVGQEGPIVSYDALLEKASVRISEPLAGAPEPVPRDSISLLFEIPPSLGDLQPDDRVSLFIRGFPSATLRGSLVEIGDAASEEPDDSIVFQGRPGRTLRAAEGATLRGLRVKASYKPIRKRGGKVRNGRLKIHCKKGDIAGLPVVPLVDVVPTKSRGEYDYEEEDVGIGWGYRWVRASGKHYLVECYRDDNTMHLDWEYDDDEIDDAEDRGVLRLRRRP